MSHWKSNDTPPFKPIPARTSSSMWRGLDADGTPGTRYSAEERQLPPVTALDRRRFLALSAASLALAGLPACGRRTDEDIIPYNNAPEHLAAGESLYYATALPLDGYARGVLVETVMGRPIKIEGNPKHPASRGATDIFAQAAILDLWDPDRSQSVLRQGLPAAWPALQQALNQGYEAARRRQGQGLAILTGTCTSPTLTGQLQALLQRHPQAHWFHQPPAGERQALAACQATFGKRLVSRPYLDKAEVILALDADPLGPGPDQMRLARDFTRGRDSGNRQATGSRLYVAEPSPTLTGAAADHRLPLAAGQIESLVRQLAQSLGLELPGPRDEHIPRPWLQALARDLRQAGPRALVLAGPQQPEAVQRIVNAVNARLGAIGTTLSYHQPAATTAPAGGLAELAGALREGSIDTLLLLEVNPVYEAPADLAFAEALARASLSIHLGAYPDETAQRCRWHIPAIHPLESWGDLRGTDGTVSLQQPIITPLYGGLTAPQLIDLLEQATLRPAREPVRAHWQQMVGETDFEVQWQSALRQGFMADSAHLPQAVRLRDDWRQGLPSEALPAAEGLELLFRPDPTIREGAFANNAWLQELPKPISKLVWDNALLIAPATAKQFGVTDGDLVRLEYDGRQLEAPVWRIPGQAEGSLTLPLGYGRWAAGAQGSGIGFNANLLRTSAQPGFVRGARLAITGGRRTLASTQQHQTMEGHDLLRVATRADYRKAPESLVEEPPLPSLYPPRKRTGHAWAMSIDLNACLGCGVCTLACQAENNIPVVGKQEVLAGREMHWIRVDRYFSGPPASPRILFQPVPCMHCELAPCEVVCPVGATLHDAEGLNLQVYNRCIGTRFCSNNCPYKVRRFNFLQYVDRDSPNQAARHNPQVTVRQRGVMEKCTYCLQRINAARRQAQLEDRPLRDGDVVTACQGACPTRAIVFGDQNDPDSQLARAKTSPRDYSLLRELNTRPRTTYQVRLRNPNPQLDGGAT